MTVTRGTHGARSAATDVEDFPVESRYGEVAAGRNGRTTSGSGMRRRELVLGGLAVLGGALGVRIALSTPESAIVKVVHKRLGYLKLEPDGVRQFARDLAKRDIISPARLRVLDSVGDLYTGSAMTSHQKLNDAIHHGEDRVTSAYLMSSDFFANGADESREVHYMGYYDPMVACSNPFARPPLG
jgi:hypothetical protein